MAGVPVPVPEFATAANYPAGANAWNSQPLKVAPSGSYYTPNVKIPAENENYLHNVETVGLENLREWCGPPVWCPALIPINGYGSNQAITWGPLSQNWGEIFTVAGGDVVRVWITRGADENVLTGWTQIGGDIQPRIGIEVDICGICEDPVTSGNWWIATTNNGNTDIKVWNWNGSSWSLIRTIAIGGTIKDIDMVSFVLSGVGYVVIASISGNDIINAYNLTSTTWTDTTLSSSSSNCRLRVDPVASAYCLAMFSATALYRSTNGGLTWPSQALPGPGGIGLVGLDYASDQNGSYWILAITNGTNDWRWYTSTDGATWGGTPRAALTTALRVVDMAALGSLVVCSLGEAASTKSVGQAFSLDGGTTWYSGRVELPSSTANTSRIYTRAKLQQNGQQMCHYNNLWFRLSDKRGLPLAGPLS